MKRALWVCLAGMLLMAAGSTAQAAGEGQPSDWGRFYHYPYVYYPQNFQKPQQYNHLYNRYQPSQQIPVYRKDWYNFYPTEKPYHMGHHYVLDVF